MCGGGGGGSVRSPTTVALPFRFYFIFFFYVQSCSVVSLPRSATHTYVRLAFRVSHRLLLGPARICVPSRRLSRPPARLYGVFNPKSPTSSQESPAITNGLQRGGDRKSCCRFYTRNRSSYALSPVAFQPQCFRILFILFSTRHTTLYDWSAGKEKNG